MTNTIPESQLGHDTRSPPRIAEVELAMRNAQSLRDRGVSINTGDLLTSSKPAQLINFDKYRQRIRAEQLRRHGIFTTRVVRVRPQDPKDAA